MPVITNAGGGGGATSDECTLALQDIPKGLKAVATDSDDEAREGTLSTEASAADSHVLAGQTYFKFNGTSKHWEKRTGARKNNGALDASLNCGESFAIPAGDTTGGKVTANSLASQTPGDAAAENILSGKTAWVNGKKLEGGILPIDGSSVIPQTYSQTIDTTGKYITGDINVKGVALPPADALKKGYPYQIGDNAVTGTFQGYVDNPLYLFNYGAWNYLQTTGVSVTQGVSCSVSDVITLKGFGYSFSYFRLNQIFDLTNYNYVKVVMRATYVDFSRVMGIGISTSGGETKKPAINTEIKMMSLSDNMIVLNVANVAGAYYIYFFSGHADIIVSQIVVGR